MAIRFLAFLFLMAFSCPYAFAGKTWTKYVNCSLDGVFTESGVYVMASGMKEGGKRPSAKTFRLYGADAPAAKASKGGAVLTEEQGRRFGLDKAALCKVGLAAENRTRELLQGGGFTVWTRDEKVDGASMYYAVIVLPDGRCLADVLVQDGLAWPEGGEAVDETFPFGLKGWPEWSEWLNTLERNAKGRRVGVWSAGL